MKLLTHLPLALFATLAACGGAQTSEPTEEDDEAATSARIMWKLAAPPGELSRVEWGDDTTLLVQVRTTPSTDPSPQ